jgi:hypothetical protein
VSSALAGFLAVGGLLTLLVAFAAVARAPSALGGVGASCHLGAEPLRILLLSRPTLADGAEVGVLSHGVRAHVTGGPARRAIALAALHPRV